MECYHCKGNMKPGHAPLHIDRKGLHITIDKAFAWVWDQCGEHLFDEKEIAAIQELVETIEQKNESLKLSV